MGMGHLLGQVQPTTSPKETGFPRFSSQQLQRVPPPLLGGGFPILDQLDLVQVTTAAVSVFVKSRGMSRSQHFTILLATQPLSLLSVPSHAVLPDPGIEVDTDDRWAAEHHSYIDPALRPVCESVLTSAHCKKKLLQLKSKEI